MKERIKQLRRTLGFTQQTFADRLEIKRGAIANYEIGRNAPTDSVIALICKEFHVNREWLIHGTGEMFVPEAEDELDALAKKYRYSDTVQVLVKKLIQLPPERQEVVTDFLIDIASEIQACKKSDVNLKHRPFLRGESPTSAIDEKDADSLPASKETPNNRQPSKET